MRDEPDPRPLDEVAFTTTFTRIAESGHIDMSLDFVQLDGPGERALREITLESPRVTVYDDVPD